jgi:ABC-type proline/glycine betaine transport system permease subunit
VALCWTECHIDVSVPHLFDCILAEQHLLVGLRVVVVVVVAAVAVAAAVVADTEYGRELVRGRLTVRWLIH